MNNQDERQVRIHLKLHGNIYDRGSFKDGNRFSEDTYEILYIGDLAERLAMYVNELIPKQFGDSIEPKEAIDRKEENRTRTLWIILSGNNTVEIDLFVEGLIHLEESEFKTIYANFEQRCKHKIPLALAGFPIR